MYAKNDSELSIGYLDSTDLIILVYEKLIDHLLFAKSEMEAGRYAISSFSKAHDLIQQGLLTCLDHEKGGELAANLEGIYEWALREMISARVNNSSSQVQDILDVMQPLYEGWLTLSPRVKAVSLTFPGVSVELTN
jgi:flagellar protein FliS